MTTQAATQISSGVDEQLIREYLNDHPDFFHNHLDL